MAEFTDHRSLISDHRAALAEHAPPFELAGVDGQRYRLADYAGSIVVLDFWSAHCPWSQHYDAWLAEQAPRWAAAGIDLLAVASNADEDPALVAAAAAERGLAFPILLDPGGRVADIYGVETTPHIFVVDRAGRLAYRGAIDDRTFRQRQATRNYLSDALEALLAGRQPVPADTPPYGCARVRYATGEAS